MCWGWGERRRGTLLCVIFRRRLDLGQGRVGMRRPSWWRDRTLVPSVDRAQHQYEDPGRGVMKSRVPASILDGVGAKLAALMGFNG
jgi:hypothetical protein